MAYLEAAVSPVPTAHKQRYIEESSKAAEVFRKHGALAVTENWADDVPEGKQTDFHRAVARKADETVVVSTILWPSKQVRDAAWPKVMEDEAMKGHEGLFDMSRMIFGGFERIVDA
ncbi:DUF1428 domain-containing protein [Parvularcula lutaonensis]|uniref:DUF1428 domain-containing protein n=1 Tax=Parvularcula lutaonensis TaxID=491923 RepID=A0ABV7M8Q8_9PROT|nr:DUF1428 domain-containing protein [Parvularcula lutaonensis]GGY44738.1 hypothetical protein GCM10007148_12070 [Parvularcula lutaonensis]